MTGADALGAEVLQLRLERLFRAAGAGRVPGAEHAATLLPKATVDASLGAGGHAGLARAFRAG